MNIIEELLKSNVNKDFIAVVKSTGISETLNKGERGNVSNRNKRK